MKFFKLLVIPMFIFYASTIFTEAAEPNAKTVTVTADGSANTVPDQISLTFTINNQNPSAKTAEAETIQQGKNLTALLKKNGVAEKYIQTTNRSLQPVFNYANGRQKFMHYESLLRIQVTLVNLDSYGPLLNQAVEAGVYEIGGIQYGTSKLEELKSKARKAAAENAKMKAIELAGHFKLKLGDAISITESSQSLSPVYGRAMQMSSLQADFNATDKLNPGEITVTVNLSATFELLR